ncbi:MAG: MCE family protein [Chlamydiia bacterium]|nr:MCE family protein [Chlamydiia bacterium]
MHKFLSKNHIIPAMFILSGILIFSYILSFTFSKNGNLDMNIMLSSSENIYAGTSINYAGKKIGLIKNIKYCPMSADNVKYYYKAKIKIDKNIKITADDNVVISSSGMLGEKVINIIPGEDSNQDSRILQKNDIMYAKIQRSVTDTANSINDMANAATYALNNVNNVINDKRSEANDILENIKNISQNINKISSQINDTYLISRINSTNDNLNKVLGELKDSLEELNNRNLWAKISDIANNVRNITDAIAYVMASQNIDIAALTHNINNILSQVGTALANKESSISLLINNKDLYSSISDMILGVRNLIYDVNRYGMFFKGNKHWQRERLPKISNPQALKKQ